MIGVIADSSERTVISEFFELFKTPWEFYRSDRVYEVLLCAGDAGFKEITAKLILIYAGQKLTSDGDERIESASSTKQSHAVVQGNPNPHLWGQHNLSRRGSERPGRRGIRDGR